MFCRQCGSEMKAADRFCSKCGAAASEGGLAQKVQHGAQAHVSPLSFGAPQERWWLCFQGKRVFPDGFQWLSERNTLFICRNHLVLVQGDEKRSAAMDVIGAMGLVGGVVGAMRGLKDSFLSKKLELTSEQAQRLFDDRLLVWCSKSDAQIWRYHEKPWLMIRSTSEQLYCPFNSKGSTIHACTVLWCTAEHTGHAKGDIDGFGVRIVDAGTGIPEKKVPEAMTASRMALPD